MSGRHYCNQGCQLCKELNFEIICLVNFDFTDTYPLWILVIV